MEVTEKKKRKRGGKYCCAGAPNGTSCTNNTHTPGISMHDFPKDDQAKLKWTQFVRRHRANFTPSAYSALCSIHFTPTDFVRRVDIDCGASAGATKMRRLERGVVPSVDAAGTPSKLRRSPSKREKRYRKKVCKC